MESTLAERTLGRAAAAMQREAIACLPEIVKLMRTLSHKSSEVSVPELADVIQKDPVVLSKVIGAANTLGYNPAAVPVVTVTQAIHVIGYERIRSLAMSLLLVEQTSRGRSSDEQREVAALALTAGCIAQSAAGSRLLINPEEAFVCASLRNFGRLVMVTCMLDEYREAQQRAGDFPSDDAFRETFGLTPLELGHNLLKSTELPEDLLLTLRALSPEALAGAAADPTTQMLALTDFAAQLAEIALAPKLTAAAFAEKSKALAARFGNLLPGLADETGSLIEGAADQLNQFVRTLRIKSIPSSSLVRLKNRAAAIDPAASVRGETAPQPSGPNTLQSSAPLPSPSSDAPSALAGSPSSSEPAALARFSWDAELARISALAHAGAARADLFSAAIDSVQRGLDARECLLFSGASGAAEFELTHGTGVCFDALNRRATVRKDERTVFGVCITRGENILIHHAGDPKLAPYLPAWLPARKILGAFVLLPIVSARSTRGLILAGWPESRQITIPPDHVRAIRLLLASVCQPAERSAA